MNATKIAVFAAIAAILLRFTFYTTGLSLEYTLLPGMTYMLIVTLSIYFALHFDHQAQAAAKELHPFSADFKNALKCASLFALMVSLYTYVHYNNIDATYFDNQIAQRIEVAQNVNMEELAANDARFEGMTKAEAIATEKENSEKILNPMTHTIITLFFFLVVGGVFSAFMTLALRILRRKLA